MRRSIPLLVWVVLALALVGLLPFGISAYQIRASRDAMLDQVQTTHLTAARATADRVAAYLELLTAVGESAARNPNFISDPGSVMAEEVLAGVLQARSEILAAGLYLVTGDAPQLVWMAQQTGQGEVVAGALKTDDPRRLVATRAEDGLRLRLRLALEDERLALVLVADAGLLVEGFEAVELGEESEVVLAGRDGEVLMGGAVLDAFPQTLVAKARSGLLRSEAGEFRRSGGERLVAAYADVGRSPWFVMSKQPSRTAETAALSIRRTAWQAFGGAVALTALLSIAANFSVVRPIRDLVRAHRRLAGLGEAPAGGSEITLLKESFALIERNVNDREALNKVFLGRYQIIDVLGAGAMGTVFRGWDPKLKRHVALKTLKVGGDLDPEKRRKLADRLVKEAVTLARLQHANIVNVFDVVHEGDAAFIAMELVDGESLEHCLWRLKRLPPSQAVPLAVALLDALDAAHREGFVHHDFKPANILLGDNDTIKVTDFGVSELLSVANRNRDVICGTPGYLAPESVMGKGYTDVSDLFAAGVVLYECLTGRPPFRGDSVRETLVQTAAEQPVPPRALAADISAELEALILRLLAKVPEDRPGDARSVAEELRQMASEQGWRWSPEKDVEKQDPAATGSIEHRNRPRTSLVPTLQSQRSGRASRVLP